MNHLPSLIRSFENQTRPLVDYFAASLQDDEIIAVKVPPYVRFIGRDKEGEMVKTKGLPERKKLAFIISKYDDSNMDSQWKTVFSSNLIDVYENINRKHQAKVNWNMSREEKLSALKIARLSLRSYLDQGEELPLNKLDAFVPQRLHLRCGGIGIALWADGQLRGSQLIENCSLVKGIISATCQAADDIRFKPLKKDDLQKIRIEISILSDLTFPIDPKIFDRLPIEEDKGYRVKYQGKTGWYLPEIFNIRKFGNFNDLLTELFEKKMHIGPLPPEKKGVLVEMFHVEDFIETHDVQNVRELSGPMGKKVSMNWPEMLIKANEAARWLMAVQENDGNYHAVTSGLDGRGKKMDWPRSVLSGWAMYEIGKATKNDAFIDSARKNYDFAVANLLERKRRSDPFITTYCYLGQLAMCFGDREKAIILVEKLKSNLDLQTKKTIPLDVKSVAFQQTASLLAEIGKTDKKYRDDALAFARQAEKIFKDEMRHNRSFAFTWYAELVNTFCILSETTKNQEYFDLAKKISDQIISNRFISGAFKTNKFDRVPNTRITGKVAEVLPRIIDGHLNNSQEKNHYITVLKDAIEWIYSMQYDRESMYFISPDRRDHLYGGIRHTGIDQDAWIDSAAHLLLAISRIISKKIDLSTKETPKKTYPLANQEELQINNSKISISPFFFGNAFKVENFFYDNLAKIAEKIPSVHSIPNFPGSNNPVIRNCGLLIEYLAEEGLLKKQPLEAILSKTELCDAPDFYESKLRDYCDPLGNNKPVFARGFSKDWRRSLGQALGEFMERYFHRLYLEDKLLRASAREMKESGASFLHPKNFDIYSEAQKERDCQKRWDEDSVFSWEKCRRLSDRKDIYLPAQLIYWNYRLDENEPRMTQSNTNGLAGYFTDAEAALSAIYETIQRDAFLYYWLNMITPERIDPDTFTNKQLTKLLSESNEERYKIHFLHLGTEMGVPAVATIIEDTSGNGPYFSVGAGCEKDVEKAVHRSLEEAWSTYYWSKNMFLGRYKKWDEKMKPFVTPMKTIDRLSVWANPIMEGRMDFFLKGDMKPVESFQHWGKSYKNKGAELEDIARRLKKLGHEAYIHSAKHEILKKTKFHSVKAIIPTLLSHFYTQDAPLDHKCIKNKNNVNPLPNPFP